MQMLKASKIFDRNRRFALVDNAWSLVRRASRKRIAVVSFILSVAELSAIPCFREFVYPIRVLRLFR